MNYQNCVENFNAMFQQSNSEYLLYTKQRDKVVLLQQAGEKIFCAVEMYLSLKYGQKIESYQQAYLLSKNEKVDMKLLYDARELHRFFYSLQEQYPDIRDAEKMYLSVKNRLRDKVKSTIMNKYQLYV